MRIGIVDAHDLGTERMLTLPEEFTLDTIIVSAARMATRIPWDEQTRLRVQCNPCHSGVSPDTGVDAYNSSVRPHMSIVRIIY